MNSVFSMYVPAYLNIISVLIIGHERHLKNSCTKLYHEKKGVKNDPLS